MQLDIAILLNNNGVIYFQTGRLNSSENAYKKGLDIWQSIIEQVPQITK
jgi:hypothetical protein